MLDVGLFLFNLVINLAKWNLWKFGNNANSKLHKPLDSVNFALVLV